MVTQAQFPAFLFDVFRARFPEELAGLAPLESSPPERTSVDTKTPVRKAIRAGGFKPSGRNKPAWEYLVAARERGTFPTINPPVDRANWASAAFGLPISLVDAAKLEPPLHLRLGNPGESYVFNPSGQILEAQGLIGLADAQGLAATPIKDCQRTKTDGASRELLAVVWGLAEEAELTQQCSDYLRASLTELGAELEEVELA